MRKTEITVVACLCMGAAFANHLPAKVVQVDNTVQTDIVPTGAIFSRDDLQITANLKKAYVGFVYALAGSKKDWRTRIDNKSVRNLQ